MDINGQEDESSELLTAPSGVGVVCLSRPKEYPSAPTKKLHNHGGRSAEDGEPDPAREAARQWRRRRLLGRKHSTSGGKVRPSASEDQDYVSPSRPSVEKPKPKKEPVPMRRRALPQSFFQEPKSMSTSSLAGSFYSVLPPLFSSENNNEEVLTVRPVTPPDQKSDPKPSKRSWYQTSPPDTELLFSLFDHLENKLDSRLIVKRGRPKKQPNDKKPPPPPKSKDEDPCVVDALSDRLFPKLSLTGKPPAGFSPQQHQPIASLSVQRLHEGDRTIELPALQVEQNYSAMLTELVTHM